METRRLSIVIAVAFIDLLGFGIVIPLIPYYAETFGASPLMVGLVIASYAAAQFIGAPIIGRFSDRYGRRPALLITILGNAIGFIVFGFASSVWMLFAGRILSGITGGNVSVVQAYVADVTDVKNRARGLGLIGAAFGVGFIIGPALGGTLSAFGYNVPVLLAAGLGLLNFIAALAFLPESLSAERRAELMANANPRMGFSLGALVDALKHPHVGPLLNARFFYSLAFNLFQGIFPLYAQIAFGLSALQTGYVFTYIGVLLVIVQGVLVGRMTARWSEYRLILAMTILTAFGMFGWGLAPNLPFLLVVFIPLSLAVGSFNTIINSALSKVVPIEEIGGTLGLSASLDSFTRIFSPAMGGWLIEVLGTWSPGLLGGIILVLLVLFTWRDLYYAQMPASPLVERSG